MIIKFEECRIIFPIAVGNTQKKKSNTINMKKILEKIIQSKPIQKTIDFSKKLSFPGHSGVSFFELIPKVINRIEKEGVNVRAASIAFNFLMAFPAIFIFLAALIPFLPISNLIFEELIHLVNDLTPNMTARNMAVKFMSDIFNRRSAGVISLSVILALYYSSRAMFGIINSFDRSIKYVKYRANFFSKRWRAILLTLVIVIMLIATILVTLGQGSLFDKIMQWLKIDNQIVITLIKNLRWIFIIALFYFSISIIYKFGPSVETRGKLYSSGSWFATAFIILATSLFSVWAQSFSNFNKFYGPIGSVMLVMLLIYIDSFILLVGFELNNSIAEIKEQKEKKLT